MSETSLLEAIDSDDRVTLKKLLRENPALATAPVTQARLFKEKILHWLYVGDTPLHLAAAGYRLEIVQWLLSAGADPKTALNHRRGGPLHYAADSRPGIEGWDPQRQVSTIQQLLKAGAKINAPDKNGATPLHRATRTRGAAAVKTLLEAGADPSIRNLPGSTPFHLAVQNTGRGGSGLAPAKAAQREIIAEFLARGAKPSLKDGNGKTVLECARSEWIQELLG